MARKVVGRISREMNHESVNYAPSLKTPSGAVHRNRRRVSAPRYKGIGGVYRDDDEDI